MTLPSVPGPLPDGVHDAIVVDATEHAPGAVALELTILAGPRKGDVVAVTGPAPAGDPLDLLGTPATITVTDGEPRVRLEP